jgi:DNA repair protein RecO (recombination protein O)
VALIRTQGIVLRARDLGEHDRLVTLYTQDLGRLTAVARGARRLRSRFGAALELFTLGDAVGFERDGRELVRLDHFDIRRSFRRLREDLDRLGHGARMVETVLRLTAERDPQPAGFQLLARALRALEDIDPPRVQLAFTLRFLDLLGHRPRLDRCASCGRASGIPAAGGVAFDPSCGGLVCAGCRPGGRRAPAGGAESGRALAVLRGLQGASWDARLRARIAPAAEREAAGLLDLYVASLAGGPLRSSRFLAQVGAAPSPGSD